MIREKQFLTFDTEAKAEAFSKSIYDAPQGSSTEYLLGFEKHPDRDQWAVVIPYGYNSHIPRKEKLRRMSQDEMSADGWFTEKVLVNG